MNNEDLQQLKALAKAYAANEIYLPDSRYSIGPDTILALIARIESLAADAERYQHLKKHAEDGALDFCGFYVSAGTKKNWDRTIDASIKEKA